MLLKVVFDDLVQFKFIIIVYKFTVIAGMKNG